MAQIEVYNPRAVPVIYGDGQTIGGLEWAMVEEELVQGHLEDGALIIPQHVPAIESEPISETPEEVSIDDSSEDETDVSSDLANEEDVAEDSDEDAPSDAPTTDEETATIRKSRRRKRTATERE